MKREVIPTCDILGVRISMLSMQDTVQYIGEHLEELSGHYICVSNVHTTVMSYDDESYKGIQNGAVMALADGGPLSAVARHRGYKRAERVAGPDLMEEIFKISVQKGYRHYFYGSKQQILDCLEENLTRKYPGICIAGMYAPPFRAQSESEDLEDIQRINEAEADFVWVGLGAPKQERWMAGHEGKVKGLMIGVGAGFDYCAGSLKRAPGWMRKWSLEWLYRLSQEPRRLMKRYAYTNIKFLKLIAEGK